MIKTKGLVVECFGMPAVGKTHVARVVARLLDARGATVRDKALRISDASRVPRALRKLTHILGSAPDLVGWTHTRFGIARAVRSRGLYRSLKILFNWAYVISLVRNEISHEGVVVLDQGFFQALWSTQYQYHGEYGPLEPTVERRLLEAALELAGRPRLIVLVVEADEDRIRQRLRGRRHGTSPLDRARGPTPETWRAARSATNRVLLHAETLAERSRLIRVVRVDNSPEDGRGGTLNESLAEALSAILADGRQGLANP